MSLSFFSFFFFLLGNVSYWTSLWTLVAEVEDVNTLVTDCDLSAGSLTAPRWSPTYPSFLVLLLSGGSCGSFLLGAELVTGVSSVPADIKFS